MNRWAYFHASPAFSRACADEATRTATSLADCAGMLARLIADAYLMGGEL